MRIFRIHQLADFANPALRDQDEDLFSSQRRRTGKLDHRMLQKPLEAINAKRNRVIAHLEQTVIHDPEKAAAATRVTFSDLNEVFLLAESILNELAGVFRGTTASFDYVGINDYDVLGTWVIRGKCAHLKQYELEFGPWDGPRPKNCP